MAIPSLKKKIIASAIIIVSFLLIPNIQANKIKTAQIPIVLSDPLEEFFLNSTIPINIIFIGFDQSNINENYINNLLKKSIAPTYNTGMMNDTIEYIGGIYELDYNFYFDLS